MSKEKKLNEIIEQGQKEALALAIKNKNPKQFNDLMKSFSIDINAKDKDGDRDTLLHIAIQNKNEAAVKFLLEKGANPDIQNKWGQTPLHLIMLESEPQEEAANKIIAHLLDHGASVNIKENRGITPQELSARKKGFAVVNEDYLHRRTWKEYFAGANPNTKEMQDKIAAGKKASLDAKTKQNEEKKAPAIIDGTREEIFALIKGVKHFDINEPLSSFYAQYTLENFKKSKVTNISDFITECQDNALKDSDLKGAEKESFKKVIDSVKETAKTMVVSEGLKPEDKKKLQEAVDWNQVNPTNGAKEMIKGRHKLKKMLYSFKFYASNVEAKGADNIDDFIELCRKKVIAGLSFVERNEGALSQGMSDLQIFETIVKNIKKGLKECTKINAFEGLPEEATKPKFTMRGILDKAKVAFSSFGKSNSSPKASSRSK